MNENLLEDVSLKDKEEEVVIFLDEKLEFEHLNSTIIEQNYAAIMTSPYVRYSVKERLVEAKRKREEEILKLINSN